MYSKYIKICNSIKEMKYKAIFDLDNKIVFMQYFPRRTINKRKHKNKFKNAALRKYITIVNSV